MLVVLGNHDYWKCNNKLSIKNGAEKCRALLLAKNILNVKILDCDTHLDGDVLFVGCTLWTDMKNADALAMHDMRDLMKYDGQIAFESGNGTYTKFSSYNWISTHYKHRDYLKIIIEQNRDKRIVVITHHSPLIDDELARNFDVSNAYYMTDLTELIMENPHVKLWVYGHIHKPTDIIKGQTRFLNNAVGYKKDKSEVKHEVIRIT